jgi:hypothetical protein
MDCVYCAVQTETVHGVQYSLISCSQSNIKPEAEVLKLLSAVSNIDSRILKSNDFSLSFSASQAQKPEVTRNMEGTAATSRIQPNTGTGVRLSLGPNR